MNGHIEPIVGRYVHVDIGGVSHRIYFEENGVGIPLVCLHTAGSDGRQWRHLLADEALAKNFRIIAFDMPWHGKSNPPANWDGSEYQLTTARYTETIRAFCKALKLDKPVVMGCSIGGRIVLNLAIDHAAEFRALIGLEAADFQAPWYDTSWLNRPDVHGGEVCAALVSGLIAPQSPDSSRTETLWAYKQGGPGVFKGDLYFYRVDGDLRGRVEKIDTKVCPLFLLTGEYDFSCTPEDTERTAAAIPRRQCHHHGAARSFSDERESRTVSPLHLAGPRRDSQAIDVNPTRSSGMKRTTIGLALAAAFCAAQANAQELTGTLKNIKETGAITLGFRVSSIPFSYLDDAQKPIGYAMDICYKIVDAVKKELKLDKLEVKLNPVTSSTRIPLLANGTIDLECGSTTNNTERQKQIAYTNTHFLTASRYITKKASKIAAIDDLKGKSVVSTAGTTNIKQLTEANAARNLNINIIPAKDHAEAFLMVETDRAVAFVMDDILLASLAAGSKAPDDYVISKDAFSKPEPYGIMLRKDDPAFKKVVDAATAALYTGGEGQKIYDKWFTQKIAPKGLNLDVPIGSELKNEFAKPSDSPDPDSYK